MIILLLSSSSKNQQQGCWLETQSVSSYSRTTESESAFEQDPRCYPCTLQLKRYFSCIPNPQALSVLDSEPVPLASSRPTVLTSSSRSLFTSSPGTPQLSAQTPMAANSPSVVPWILHTELCAVALLSQLPCLLILLLPSPFSAPFAPGTFMNKSSNSCVLQGDGPALHSPVLKPFTT